MNDTMHIALHIDPDGEYGPSIVDGDDVQHLSDLVAIADQDITAQFYPQLDKHDLDGVTLAGWLSIAANTSAITGDQFFAAGAALDFDRIEF